MKRSKFSERQIIEAIKGQEEWDQLDIGRFYDYKGAAFGIFYRGFPVQKTVPNNFNQDAMILMASYKYLGLKICYSYDITISKVWKNTGGTHEFALITQYPFKPKKRRRSARFLPCPKF